jgi:AcrR family transcriptional regulator
VAVSDKLTLLPVRTQLPRGRSSLPGTEVAESQRGRILQAMIEEVAEHGYAATRVQDVINRARVSRKAFYDVFTDKQDAFAAAHLAASQQLLDLVAGALLPLGEAGWRDRHRACVQAYLAGFVSAPAYAVALMVEIHSAGARLLDQREQVMNGYTARIMRFALEAHAERPDRPVPSELVVLGVVAAADELVTRQIRAGRLARLPELLTPILQIQLAVIAGGDAS